MQKNNVVHILFLFFHYDQNIELNWIELEMVTDILFLLILEEWNEILHVCSAMHALNKATAPIILKLN